MESFESGLQKFKHFQISDSLKHSNNSRSDEIILIAAFHSILSLKLH